MNQTFEVALNQLYQYQMTTREQLLNEMLRVKTVRRHLDSQPAPSLDRAHLFRLMRETTEDAFGAFTADSDAFFRIYTALQAIDLVEFTLVIYENDRTGTVITPSHLNSYIAKTLMQFQPTKVLIAEAEKHLAGLTELIRSCPNSEITLTTQLRQMSQLLQLAFAEFSNVRVTFQSIYSRSFLDERFDFIYSMPSFGLKPDNADGDFLTRDSDGVALENLLGHLSEVGTLQIVLPAKLTFAGMGYEDLRRYIISNFGVQSIYLLPEGTFRPASAVKFHLFSICAQPQSAVVVGALHLESAGLQKIDERSLASADFAAHTDWRVELLLSTEDEVVGKFRTSRVSRVRLKSVAEVFRGKSILKKDTSPGRIAVLNISDIDQGEIDYSHLDTIDEEEEKVKRYELLAGDVVLSCRGTAIKSAVFACQPRTVIASANLIVVRPGAEVRAEYIKIFLESPLGLALIKSFQRGTTIMNINHSDIMEMEIPLLSLHEQQIIIDNYLSELSTYKQTVSIAEQRWGQVRQNLYDRLTGEGLEHDSDSRI